MKRVLQVVVSYYPRIGGIEQVARDIVHTLNGMDDIEQKVICLGEDGADGELVRRRNQSIHDQIDETEIIRCGSICKFASQLISPSYPFELSRVMKEFDPDIVIFHYPNPFLAAFLLAHKKRKFKLIVYWQLDITKQKMLGRLFRGQTIGLLNRADVIWATSQNYIDGSPYLQQYREKCRVLSCCIDPNRMKVTPHAEELAEEIRQKYTGKTICFTCGRHVPYKGLTYLIKASRYLDDRFRILIGGQGDLTNELKREAAGDEKIEFLGRLTDEELAAYYIACDIYCFPSITKNEAFGIALAEAMYCGKPAVTFTIPGSGVNYVNLSGVTGIECPNGDSKAYAEALIKLAEDEELRKQYGNAAKARVEEEFSVERFQKRVCELLQE